MNAEKLNQLSRIVIGKAFVVSNTLGAGFLEKIYENALAFELREADLGVKQQHDIAVYYRDNIVGAYSADLLIEDALLVELKAVTALDAIHQAQCMNYLKATRLSLCLLINFGHPRVEIKRVANGI
ncbi:MAG: GxxExxY protein [Rhodopila sp.]|jgi:GxxExxY protein